jgi:hypothetical protein
MLQCFEMLNDVAKQERNRGPKWEEMRLCIYMKKLTPKGHPRREGDHSHYPQRQVSSHAFAPTDPLS